MLTNAAIAEVEELLLCSQFPLSSHFIIDGQNILEFGGLVLKQLNVTTLRVKMDQHVQIWRMGLFLFD